MSYTKDLYNNSVADELKKEFSYKNSMEVPKVEKVALNVSFKAADADNNFLKYVVDELSLIAGQKAVLTKAKKSIAGFKLREGMPIGCRVTLRRDRMYEFLDRLVYIALPRVRDFRGLASSNFNQSGHYSFGIKEHTIFPEINIEKAYKAIGMTITIVTNAKSNNECKSLLKKLNFPIN